MPTFIQRSRNVRPAEKARRHHLTGAGKRKTLRKFFGLSRDDEKAIVKRVDKWLDRHIK